MVKWRQGPRRRRRIRARMDAARLLRDHPGPLMNLLGETVIDLYEEIMMMRLRREQEQYLVVEYVMRLDLAISHGGDEFRWYRDTNLDTVDLAVVASTVWCCLNGRHGLDYTNLEVLQAKLRSDGPRIAGGILYRTRKQAAAFRYWNLEK